MNIQLRSTREKSGKTQARVAREANVSEISYQLYEYDKREPGVRTAIRIADTLQVETYQEFKKLFGAATPDREGCDQSLG